MLRFARLYANTKRFLRRFAATPHPSRHSPCHLLLQEKALGTVRIGALNTNLKIRSAGTNRARPLVCEKHRPDSLEIVCGHCPLNTNLSYCFVHSAIWRDIYTIRKTVPAGISAGTETVLQRATIYGRLFALFANCLVG